MYNLTYGEALVIIGGLSKPSKMPWWGWSISAMDCQTGSKLREVEGSVCSKCYAMRGNYVYPVVRASHLKRKGAMDNDPRFVEAFILVLNTLHKQVRRTYIRDGVEVKENRFRWFDAGDIQSTTWLTKINQIAEGCPDIDFWLPTKEAGIVNQFLKEGGVISPNLLIRLSAPMIGQTYKKPPAGLPYATVGVEDGPVQCPAYGQGGKCLSCRQCWDKMNISVNYPQH